jgi:hypothetical protein
MTKQILFLFFLSLTCTIQVVAQDIESADKLYEIHAFDAAIEMYEAVIKTNPAEVKAYANIGDCYRRTNRMQKAANWYAKAINTGKANPEIFFQYGLVLKGLGRYTEAKEWFKSYGSVDAQKGNLFAASCDFAILQKNKKAAYEVSKELINSSTADFGATINGSNVIYSSSRADLGKNSTWLGSNISQMLISSTNWKGNMKNPEVLLKGIKAKKDVGPASYSADGKKVYYTVNNFENGTRWLSYNGLVTSIEEATVNADGSWSEAKVLPFNKAGYSAAFPVISRDGNSIYFSSDNPEGEGGFDIYVSKKQGDTWSKPTNLGKTINTVGDEITPSIDRNVLYFSSNWHQGLGGFDIFRAQMVNSTWRNPTNLGNNVNSTRDDLCYTYSREKSYGYISSNRLGGKGDLDIYKIKNPGNVVVNSNNNNSAPGNTTNTNNNNNTNTNTNTNNNNSTSTNRNEVITIRVVNAANLEGIPFADLDFTKCSNGGSYKGDAKGIYIFNAPSGFDCQITVSKNDFESKLISLKSIGSTKRTLEVKLDPKGGGFAGFVYDNNTKNAVPNVLITALDLSSGQQMQVLSNNVGRYMLGLKSNTGYSVSFSKAGYINSNIQINTLDGSNKNILGQQILARSGTTNPDIDGTVTEEIPVIVGDRGGNADKPGWAVQIGVFSKPNIIELQKLKVYGNVFREPKGTMMSYKVGTYTSKEEAVFIKNKIRKETGLYKDAWVTAVYDMEVLRKTLIEEDVTDTDYKKETENSDTGIELAPPGVTYKVQLGVYKNLKWFPEEKFSDLGQLEIRPRTLANGDEANVVLLGNYNSKAEAEQMKSVIAARGLANAYVVSYKNGKPVK